MKTEVYCIIETEGGEYPQLSRRVELDGRRCLAFPSFLAIAHKNWKIRVCGLVEQDVLQQSFAALLNR